MARLEPYHDGRRQSEEAHSSLPEGLSVRNRKLDNIAKKLDGIPDAIKKGTAGGRTWKEDYDADVEWGEMRKEKEKKENILIQTEAVSGTSVSGRSAVSGVSGVGEKFEKIEKNERSGSAVSGVGSRSAESGMSSVRAVSGVSGVGEKIEKIEKNEENGRIGENGRTKKNEENRSAMSGASGRNERSGSGVSGAGAVSGASEYNEKNEKNEKNEENGRIGKNGRTKKNEENRSAVSGPSGKSERSAAATGSSAGERIVRLSAFRDTAGEAARGRAGHVELQGGSSGTIPLFPVDEILIRPDHGNQEVPRCLEPSDHSDGLRIRLSGTEHPSKGPKIWSKFDPGGLEAWISQVGLTVEEVADTGGARSMVYTRDGRIRNVLVSTTDESIPTSWGVSKDSVNMEFVVFPEDDLAQYRSGNQSLASRICSGASNEDVRAEKGEKAENRRREFERWKEWEPGETTRGQLGQPEEPDRWEHLGQPKGQKRLLCLAGVDGLAEALGVALPLDSDAVGLGTTVSGTVIGVVSGALEQGVNLLSSECAIGPELRKDLDTANPDTTDPNATDLEVHCPARPDPWPDEMSYEGLQQPKYHSGERDPNAISEKCTEGEEVLDMQPAARLEAVLAVNQRLRALSAEYALELGTEAISQDATALKAIQTEDIDPDSTESEEPLPARPDPWPGDDKRAGEVRGHGNVALFAQLHVIRAEQGRVKEVLWAEAEREEVREEARQRRQVYAEWMVAQTSRNLVKPGLIRAGDLVMLWDTAVAKEKGLKLYYRWTGPYLVRSVTQGGMSFVLQHPHEDKAPYGTHHQDDVRLWTVHSEHLRYPSGVPIQPEFPTNLRQYRKGLIPHLAGKLYEVGRRVRGVDSEWERKTRKRRRV